MLRPTLRSTTTTTTLPPRRRPRGPTTRRSCTCPTASSSNRTRIRTLQPRRLDRSDGDPIVTKEWTSVNGATWENQTRDQGTENAVLKWTSPGWKTICFSATDSLGATGSDCCDVCVKTGVVAAAITGRPRTTKTPRTRSGGCGRPSNITNAWRQRPRAADDHRQIRLQRRHERAPQPVQRRTGSSSCTASSSYVSATRSARSGRRSSTGGQGIDPPASATGTASSPRSPST